VSSKLSKSAKGELVFTSFLFLAGVIVIFNTAQLELPVSTEIVTAQVVPYAIGIILVVLSLLQFIGVLRGDLGQPEGIEGGEVDSKPHLGKFFLALGGLVQFAVLVNFIGFIASGTIMFFLVALALGAKKWWKILIVSLVVVSAVYVGFTQGLQIDLPLGINFSTETEVEEW
jgi:putative tricarboxylic transport membrane protein